MKRLHRTSRGARRGGGILSCREFLTEFGDYLDGSLTEEVHQELEAHVARCQTCQVIHDSTRKTLRLVSDSGSFELPTAEADVLVTRIMDGIRSGKAPESEPKSENSSR